MTNVYNIPSDGKLRVNFTGRYLSRSGLTAISTGMDPDSVFSKTEIGIRLCSSVFSAPRQNKLLLSASLKWRRCDYTRAYKDKPFTLLVSLTQNVHALRSPIRYSKCQSESPHPLILWLHYQSFGPTYSQIFAVRQGNCILQLAGPIQQHRSAVRNRLLNIIQYKMRGHRGHPSPYHITLRQRVRSDGVHWSIWLQRGLPG